ncbi:MAG: IS1 family transposase [Candidatus Methanomethylophilaceae archaeon]|nr:IS1 family transposase [Candidatus Methanomethylophilaceae archaeon]
MEQKNDQGLWDGIKDILESMSDPEKKAAIRQLRDLIDRELISMEIPDAARKCCNCGGTKFVRNGHTAAGTQRFKCRCCGLTQSFSSTGSVLGYTKLDIGKWHGFAECFVNRYTCQQTADKLGVGLETAWYMRVRLMEAI